MLLNCPHCHKTVASQAEYPEHPGTWVFVAGTKDLEKVQDLSAGSVWKCLNCTGMILYAETKLHPIHDDWQLIAALQRYLQENNIKRIRLEYILPALYTDNSWRLYQYLKYNPAAGKVLPYVGRADYQNNQVTKWTP